MVIARERERFAEASGDVELFLAALEARLALTRDPVEVAALRRHQARVVNSQGGTGDASAPGPTRAGRGGRPR